MKLAEAREMVMEDPLSRAARLSSGSLIPSPDDLEEELDQIESELFEPAPPRQDPPQHDRFDPKLGVVSEIAQRWAGLPGDVQPSAADIGHARGLTSVNHVGDAIAFAGPGEDTPTERGVIRLPGVEGELYEVIGRS